ncbi:MAG TPA: DUF1800 domain-containing protein [Vicinamibacterales bacterium]|nr:DUF1800 domain-containing protein [Vicinamibacterales bacterium]
MAELSPFVEHLLRRAGFGASEAERERFSRYTYPIAVSVLTNFNPDETNVDDKINTPGYVQIPGNRQFLPNQVLADARNRWLFRMVHSPAPLQEKMALIWHHHFATAHSKIAGTIGNPDAVRLMAAKPSEDSTNQRGQIELFREYALGNFHELLVEVAKDPAMLYWLDGYLNRRGSPQENFGRELMELFTIGVDHHTESDVYAAARVFTGWNLVQTGTRGTSNANYAFRYNANNHDTDAKEFSFPIYRDGSRRIQPRSAAAGMQDGLDLISALATHPETARRMARRLWTWFVSETETPDDAFVDQISNVYLANDTNMKPVIRAVLFSKPFTDPARFHQRYGWPVEFVVRSLKEVGYSGFNVDTAATPMLNMGQQLFEPPDVNGWDLGPGWFSTGGMLARLNFASALATNQRAALRDAARAHNQTPETLLEFAIGRLSIPEIDGEERNALLDYIRAGGAWTGSESQLLTKTAGLFHLLTGSGIYQFV